MKYILINSIKSNKNMWYDVNQTTLTRDKLTRIFKIFFKQQVKKKIPETPWPIFKRKVMKRQTFCN